MKMLREPRGEAQMAVTWGLLASNCVSTPSWKRILQVQSSLWMAEASASILCAARETLSQNYLAKPPWANSAKQTHRPSAQGPQDFLGPTKMFSFPFKLGKKKEILGTPKKSFNI